MSAVHRIDPSEDRIRKWKIENPDKVRLQRRRYYLKNKERICAYQKTIKMTGKSKVYARRADLKKKYGITPEIYELMFERQGGVCAICKIKQVRRLSVDHCHVHGTIRGLLCNNCNTAIGHLHDDPMIAKAAVEYLIGASP